MRITIDTETNTIILPNTFFKQIDEMNEVLAKAGTDKQIDYKEFVKDEFEKAWVNPHQRQSDIVKTRAKKKDSK